MKVKDFTDHLNANPPVSHSLYLRWVARSKAATEGCRFGQWLLRHDREEFDRLHRALMQVRSS